MGRTIQTQKGKAKWYDLPLTEQEIERGNTIGEFEESSKDEQKSAYIYTYAHPTQFARAPNLRQPRRGCISSLGGRFGHAVH